MTVNQVSKKVENIVLQIENASFFYEESGIRSWVLQSVDLTTHASEICAIVGPSGCGKTTLIKIAISLLPLSDGTVKLFGRDAGDPSVGIPGPNVGYMPQEDALPSDLRVRDSLYFFGLLNNMSIGEIRKRMDEVLEQVDLIENSGKFIFQLSGGMKRRLSLAIALLHSPQLLILDEPTVGCDPVLRSRIWKVLRQISSENRTSIVITTHYIEECRFADTVNFMRDKTFAVQSRPEQILSISGTSNLDKAFFRICFSAEKSFNHGKKSEDQVMGSKIERKQVKFSSEPLEPVSPSKSLRFSQIEIVLILILRYTHALLFDMVSVQLILVMPTMISVMIHTCLTPRVIDAPIGIVIENQTLSYDKQLFDQLELKPKCFECLHPRHFVEYMNHEVFKVIPYRDLDTALDDVRAGKITGVVHIGDQFAEHYVSRVTSHWTDLQEASARNTIIKFYGDASKQFVFRAFDTYLLEAYTKYWEASKINLGMKNGSLFPFEYEDPVIGQKKDEIHDKNLFTETGYFVSIIFCSGITLGGFLMLSELKDKTMKRCLATGLKTYHLFASQLITNGFFVGITSILSMFSVMYLLDLSVTSSAVAGASIAFLVSIIGVVFGQTIAVTAQSEISILLIGCSFSFLGLGLMGGAFPLKTQPYYTKTFAHFLPLTIPTIGLRSAIIRGFSFTNLLIIESHAILLLYLLAFSLITLRILYKRMHK
ncbi:uncharacterized protein LOC141852837 [Brevipalpus obovatus]|uniref:uncharacterized protein LOC141852837 n=1 Tax=Brevipalpus obovatus TaxID=246614 RepID=UPI003D9F83CC